MRYLLIIFLIIPFHGWSNETEATGQKEVQELDSNTQVVLTKPVDLSKDKSASAKIYFNKQSSEQSSSDDLVFKGIVTKSPQVESYRVNILWNEYTNGKDVQKIDPALSSTLITKDQVLPASKPFVMKGKFNSQLAQAVQQRKIKAANSGSSETNENSNNRTASSPQSNRNGTLRTGGSSGGSNATSSPTEANLPEIPTDSTNRITYDVCLDRYDTSTGTAYEQKAEVISDQTGKIISRGECLDTGITKPLEITNYSCDPERRGDTLYLSQAKVYSANGNEISRSGCLETGETTPVLTEFVQTCGHTTDINTGIAYKRLNEYAMVDGSRVDLTSCLTDTGNPINLSTRTEDCPINHNFVGNFSTQLHKFYYVDNGQEVFVTDCIASETTYNHSLTSIGCSPIVDTVNNKVTIMSQPSYTINGQVYYPASCTPESQDTTLTEETCTPSLVHDFSSNSSTLLTRYYYLDNDNQKNYATSCQQSSTSFFHAESTNDCSIRFDKSAKVYYQSTQTTVSDGTQTYVLSDCSEKTPAVPYQTSLTKVVSFPSLDTRTSSSQPIVRQEGQTFHRNELSPDVNDNRATFNVTFDGATQKSVEITYEVINNGNVVGSGYAILSNPNGLAHLNYLVLNDSITLTLEANEHVTFYAFAWSGTANTLNKGFGSVNVTASWD